MPRNIKFIKTIDNLDSIKFNYNCDHCNAPPRHSKEINIKKQ